MGAGKQAASLVVVAIKIVIGMVMIGFMFLTSFNPHGTTAFDLKSLVSWFTIACFLILISSFRSLKPVKCRACNGTGRLRPSNNPYLDPLTKIDSKWIEPYRCRQCRYDLTGNMSGVCPECGMSIDGAAK